MTKSKVAIIGYGVVGQEMHRLFPDALIYNGEKHPVGKLTYNDINKTGISHSQLPNAMKLMICAKNLVLITAM